MNPSESEEAQSMAWVGLPRVLELTGLGRTNWLDKVKDGTAPQPIREGRRTLWVEGEVRAWMANRVRRYREAHA
jgi:predicted DNA-binding transcriptional regulator AlpA